MPSTIRRHRVIAILFALATAASLVYSVVAASVGIRAAVDVTVPLQPGQEASCCGGADGEERLHLLAGSYYTFKDGMASKLLLNNKGPHQLEVHPMLFSTGGEELDLPPVTVEGQSFRIINMGEWIAAAEPQFQEGSIRLLHRGRDLVLGAQVFVNDEARSLSFEEKLVEPVTFKSTRLEGLWWLPGTGGEVLLAVSNATGAQVSAVVTVHGERPRRDARTEVTLAPHETRVFDVQRDLTGHGQGSFSRYGGITVTHSGVNGAVLARGFARDADAGYSLAMQFSDPSASKSTKLQGAGLRVGRVGDAALTPVFVARNVGEEAATVTGRLPYTSADGSVTTIALPELRLAPGQISVIDASQMVRAAGLSRATATAGVEFEYTGAPGGVTVTALSYGRGGDQLFRVPLWDISAQRSSTGGYPWLIDGSSSTTVFIKNTADHPLKYYLQLNHPGGVYSVGIKTIEAKQTVTYDLSAMRDRQVPGAQGEIIPLDAAGGQLHWSKVDTEEGVLIGRSEQADVVRAVSNNYACMNCCNDVPTGAQITPESGEGTVGDSQNFVSTQRLRDCYGYETAPTEVYAAQWSSSNDSVASVSVGQVTAQAPGTVTITARWTAQTNRYQYDTWDFDRWAGLGGTGSCQPDTTTLSARATYTVVRVNDVSAAGAKKITAVTGNSNITHFVTPKGASGDKVTLTATVEPNTTAVRGKIDWEGATEDPSDPLKATVSKDATAKHVVKIKYSGKVAKELRVWVVWSQITSTPIAIDYRQANTGSPLRPGGAIRGGYNFTHTIQPQTIITDADRPDLSGSNATSPPGGNHPIFSSDPLSGGAGKKWDNSRQIRARQLNPAGIADSDIAQPPFPDISYPADDVEGNDDRGTGDENNDPYTNGGVLSGFDRPQTAVVHSAGAEDDTYEVRFHFREFTRLEIEGTWYRISDFYLWRIHMKFRKVGGLWINDGSTTALDNSGF